MTASLLGGVLVAVAGGFGALARFVLDELVTRRVSKARPLSLSKGQSLSKGRPLSVPTVRYPVAITVVNISGSLLLGLLTGLTLGRLVSERWHLVLGTGFLGGYTTFSTASVQTVDLLRGGRPGAAAANAFAVLAGAVAAAALGLWVGLAV